MHLTRHKSKSSRHVCQLACSSSRHQKQSLDVMIPLFAKTNQQRSMFTVPTKHSYVNDSHSKQCMDTLVKQYHSTPLSQA